MRMDYEDEERQKQNFTLNNMFDFIKKFYERIKLKQIAVVAVIVTQALKRFVQSKHALLILDLVPLPWASLAGKILGYLVKANELVPEIVKTIIVVKGFVDEKIEDEKVATQILADHLSHMTELEVNEFWRDYALLVMNALSNDGIIDDEERKQINDEVYRKLLKK